MGKKRNKSKTAKLAAPNATKETSASESINDDMRAAALCSIPQTVLMKVCRLCETKDGPFLNIFDSEKVTAKKIDEIMPFGIAENDDLPHKICFRCSAKVEELYEFIQKCIKTQESLRTAIGNRHPLIVKTKTCDLWKEKLNETNLSNDDICNALIQKAMEGIKDIPLNALFTEEEKPKAPSSKIVKNNIEPVIAKKDESAAVSSKNNKTQQSDDDQDEVSLKKVKLSIEKCDDKISLTRTSRSSKPDVLLEGLAEPSKKVKQYPSRKSQSKVVPAPVDIKSTNDSKQPGNQILGAIVSDDKNKDEPVKELVKDVPAKAQEAPPPINIMDHVSTIKVNGVGTLFLCKLCNRNFLKKEVVMTHGCAKNNVPKDSFMQNHVPPPDIPKPSTVKYIKMDKDFKKPVLPETKPVEKKPTPPDSLRVNIPVQPEHTFKPKMGPASKTKTQTRPVVSKEPTPPPAKLSAPQEDKPAIVPSVQFPGIPSLNSRYKLVPGPNNTFTLVEDSNSQNKETPPAENILPVENQTPDVKDKIPSSQAKSKKRKALNDKADLEIKKLISRVGENDPSTEVIDLDDNIPSQPPIGQPFPVGQPYPVGLFQTVPHHSGVFAPNKHPQPPAFTTPALKKQSYTIVQTGNPSKLLISTKPQPLAEEPTRKKSKKTKPESRETNKEPFNVTLEDNSHPKDSGFFTFINVDPLLQPSYVLPTDNIIQESQISTSTPASKGILENKEKEKYACNMCGDKFSREKKLLAHIQSHYNQMDEEDQLRAEKSGPKRKTRKP